MRDSPAAGASIDLARFPWPERWARPGRAVSVLVTAGFATAVVVGVVLLVTGELRGARGALGAGALPVLALLSLLVLRTRVQRRRPSTDEVRAAGSDEAPAGVAVPYRRDTAMLRGLLSAYQALVGLVLSVGGLALLAQGDAPGGVAALIGAGLLAAAVPALRRWAASRGRPPVLVLTPGGLVHRTPRTQVEVAWRDVLSVVPSGGRDPHVLVAVAQRAGAHGTAGRTTLLRPVADRLAPHLAVPASEVVLDPVVLVEALRWYLAHPEARTELAGPAGLDRVRRGQV
ncbi:hypothetical protein J4G33_15205 [Actinotalea sp. BY-33]|uniref:Uncharacterized protein n=1 Tax=Actinotalea soli TaxID=2819234 RepID=A0A939RT11_9CELL|nr:hypothetical protein [Actinotalea soli]MBO1753157.1 hypothetical protein [Actinotalea soli]